MRDLSDKVIIITGASSGIGAATAVQCARAGMNVVISARREEKLRAVAQQITALGRQAEIIPGDVTEASMSTRLLDAALTRFGSFDAVFANAGYGIDRPMHTISDRELRDIFETNFFAAFDLIQKAAAGLIESRKPGHLLMCSSCLAKFTLPNASAYSATKAAQNHVCRAMRIELKPHRIEVASVHPIGTYTEFFDATTVRSHGVEASNTNHAPRLFMQPPEKVAKAVVKCLRRPRPEVWTSLTTRIVAGAMTAFPGFLDLVMHTVDRVTNSRATK